MEEVDERQKTTQTYTERKTLCGLQTSKGRQELDEVGRRKGLENDGVDRTFDGEGEDGN